MQIDRETMHELLGTSACELRKIADLWAANEIHSYQFFAEVERICGAVAQRAAEAERRPITEEMANQFWADCLSKYKRPGPFELINEFLARSITKEQA